MIDRLPGVLGPALLALAVCLLLTPVVRALARRYGAVATPKGDRWHRKPTALLGGISIFLATTAVILFHGAHPSFLTAILPASAVLFAVGLLDDLLDLKPYQKLIGQVIGASIVIYGGLVLPWTASQPLNQAITILWLVGITNATNMLDNMDGLAAGIGLIASSFLVLNFLSQNQLLEATSVAALAGALLAFLVYNSQPASIFMGDCGSLFIGFFLASTALLTATSGRTRSILPVIGVPVLILLIPIFDTTFVTLLRKLAGRAASQGGRDHTSHRLVALGLSERRAVWLLYSLAAVSGVLALKVRQWPLHQSVAAIIGVTIVLTLIGVYLAGVKVYDTDTTLREGIVAFLVDISYKRRVFETLLDVGLIFLSYYIAYRLRFGDLPDGDVNLLLFVRTVPLVIGAKVAVFSMLGLYRGLWRYIGLHDLFNIAKTVVVASLASVLLVVYTLRFVGFSRGVFVLDCILLFCMIAGSRGAFRVIRSLLPRTNAQKGRPVLIYGAGDAGELLLRELLNNHELEYAPAGFLDDDPRKFGKFLHGLRIYSSEGLKEVCEELHAAEVIVSSSKIPPDRLRELATVCDALAIPLKQMRIELAPLNRWDVDPLEEPVAADGAVQPPHVTIRAYGSTRVLDHSTYVRRSES